MRYCTEISVSLMEQIMLKFNSMLKRSILLLLTLLCLACGEEKRKPIVENELLPTKVKLMTLNPGHFHAALVHKTMYPEIDSTLHIYAPEGLELQDFLSKIEGYNTRDKDPTQWNVKIHKGDDFLNQMIGEKPGNVMVVAGKNSEKTDYILAAVKAGINVFADKPMAINPKGFLKLKEAFKIAKENNVLLYDIMTERFESTTIMQKMFSGIPSVFGDVVDGTIAEPSVVKESVHHFYKHVSGKPLVRPSWFFDVNEEGEGIVDVTTHLVDLVQWELFPNQVIDTAAIEIVEAKRWPTILTLEEFANATQQTEFPDYLQKDMVDGELHVYCNGEVIYKINGKVAKVSVIWNYKAPEGAGDTHYSIMRGTKANLVIKQGKSEGYKPTLYIESIDGVDLLPEIKKGITNSIEATYQGVTVAQVAKGVWKINIPEKYKIGHEAHFSQVTKNFLKYYKEGVLPEWEVPNMIAKYYTTTTAYKKAME